MVVSMFVEQIKPEHEFRHVPDDDPTYNESTYYNFACPESGVVGWLRVAMQANQPASQAGLMLFLPDGESVFDYRRTGSVSPDELAAGGLQFEIVEPHVRQRLTFDGELPSFTDPRVLASPSSAFRDAPRRKVRIDLSVHGHGPSFGTNGDDPANYVEDTMALGHFEQFIRVEGDIVVDGERLTLAAGGLRDHSWGPRDWAGPLWYRWPVATLDDGTQVMGLWVARRNGDFTREAALVRDGVVTEIAFDDVTVRWTSDGFGEEVLLRFTTPDGPLTLTARAREPHRFFPLRHHRQDETGATLETRIGYAAYDFTTSDGRSGVGMVEILDQLVDGLPQGMHEERSANASADA